MCCSRALWPHARAWVGSPLAPRTIASASLLVVFARALATEGTFTDRGAPGTACQINGHVMEKLALGAVQLGLPYGAANQTGMPSIESATAIVEVAVNSCVPFVDTAAICEPSTRPLHDTNCTDSKEHL